MNCYEYLVIMIIVWWLAPFLVVMILFLFLFLFLFYFLLLLLFFFFFFFFFCIYWNFLDGKSVITGGMDKTVAVAHCESSSPPVTRKVCIIFLPIDSSLFF